MIKQAIERLISGQSLSTEGAAQVMEEIMTGEATPAQFSAFITALRIKGESVAEIVGLARVMRTKAVPVKVSCATVDTCGTGGDASDTFNISTTAAFIVAGLGLKVAKHGNRAMTSNCGSADVLEALGVKIDLGADGVRHCLETVGIGFMFAPIFHPAMKHAVAPRREIGIRTVFNILGPLTNPAGAQAQVIGVADETMAAKMAQVLQQLGCRHVLVVHGDDGLDEISISGKTKIWELKGNSFADYTITPEDFGLARSDVEEIKGGSVKDNATILREILKGKKGPRLDIVLLNAAAGLVIGDRVADINQGVALARQCIDNGSALGKLEEFIRVSQSLG
jgi:anthranilate phosphoribosyltransferase